MHAVFLLTAGELNYGADEIDSFSLAFKRQSSPTDELLRDWGHRNSKIDHLYRILNYLNLTRPMSFIEDIGLYTRFYS